MRPSLPAELCEACRQEMPDHWLHDFWAYCEHNRVMTLRRNRDPYWTVVRKVKPKHAAKHLAAGIARITAWAEEQGYSLAEADALLTKLRSLEKK